MPRFDNKDRTPRFQISSRVRIFLRDNFAKPLSGTRGLTAAPLILMIFVAAGCSEKGVHRFEVTGTVKLDGKPVPNAILTLVPAPGTMAPTSGASIVDGRFEIPKAKGPIEGEYIFQFTGRSDKPSGQFIEGKRGREAIMLPLFPDRYGPDSKEVRKINADSHHFDFDLTSD